MRRLLLLVALALPVTGIVAFAALGSERSETTVATRATAAFHDVGAAKAAGYTVEVFDLSGTSCIAQPGEGAMGIHYLNPALVDGTIDAAEPELLVYERRNDGSLKLVALEYLVLESAWQGARPPTLFGRTFDRTTDPNRYGLPNFYALHAWLWKPNPSGLLHAWNPRVSC